MLRQVMPRQVLSFISFIFFPIAQIITPITIFIVSAVFIMPAAAETPDSGDVEIECPDGTELEEDEQYPLCCITLGNNKACKSPPLPDCTPEISGLDNGRNVITTEEHWSTCTKAGCYGPMTVPYLQKRVVQVDITYCDGNEWDILCGSRSTYEYSCAGIPVTCDEDCENETGEIPSFVLVVNEFENGCNPNQGSSSELP